MKRTNTIFGVYDLNKAPLTLGNLIFLAEELLAQAEILRFRIGGVFFVHRRFCSSSISKSSLLSVITAMQGIDRFFVANSTEPLRKFLTWPDMRMGSQSVSHSYGCSIFLQNFFRKQGKIPRLSLKKRFSKQSDSFLKKFAEAHVPVVVHLKNNPKEPRNSNADFDEWLSFFKNCQSMARFKFILIGNEKIDERILRLPNVISTARFGGTLLTDLALIQSAFVFMGMASGPANMAIFGGVPCLIYKNPGHDAKQMALELGNRNRFSFMQPTQSILRQKETAKRMVSQFRRLVGTVKAKDLENVRS